MAIYRLIQGVGVREIPPLVHKIRRCVHRIPCCEHKIRFLKTLVSRRPIWVLDLPLVSLVYGKTASKNQAVRG